MSDQLSIEQLRIHARCLGYRLEPITKLDEEKEAYARCLTMDDIRRVASTLPGPLEPAAIPTQEELERRREHVRQLMKAGIDPFKPVEPLFGNWEA